MKDDLKASIAVFLVALPLGLGIAVASGYPPMAGLVSGIVGGILVGAISGAPLQVTGAAAGLTVVVLDGVNRYGIKTMGMVVMLAGLFQVAMAMARTGRLFQAIAPSVVGGMLAGIGCLIIKGQSKVMIGPAPFLIGGLTILLLVALPKIKPLAKLPAMLVAVVVASVVAAFTGYPAAFVDIPDAPLAGFSWPFFDFQALWTRPEIVAAALQLALIASAESLLCAAAVDTMQSGERTDYDKELGAQGIGNFVCGLLGALPVTGVIVRSAANVKAGARTRWSAILHGVWLLVMVLAFGSVLEKIPMAALAGLLVYTGAKLLNVPGFVQTFKRDRAEFGVMAATFVGVVAIDLLSGVIIGLVLSVGRLAHSLSELKLSLQQQEARRVVVRLSGAATFLKLPKLAQTLNTLPGEAEVVLESVDLRHVDQACVVHLKAWADRHRARGGQVAVECMTLRRHLT